MTSRAAAARYARALFDVARAEGVDLEALRSDLSGFASMASAHEGLARIFANPAVPAAKKRAIVDALIARTAAMPPILARTLRLLADRDRLVLLDEIAAAFERRLLEYRQVVRAEIVTAMELPPDRVSALREGLGAATGREVHIETRVDPSIIGGAITRIGSTVYDGSVTRQLQRMKASLVEVASR
jgi:F-type H+-transporting ATPase subunit delta